MFAHEVVIGMDDTKGDGPGPAAVDPPQREVHAGVT